MKIYFSASTKNLEKHIDRYLRLRACILREGHALVRDWLRGETETAPQNVYKKVMTAIIKSDAVIFEGSVPSLSVGYQIRTSLNNKKPVLLLLEKEAQVDYGQHFLSQEDHELLTVAEYNEENLEEVVKKFLKLNDGNEKLRFNLVLPRELNNYVTSQALLRGTSKTEVIKHLIEKDMYRK